MFECRKFDRIRRLALCVLVVPFVASCTHENAVPKAKITYFPELPTASASPSSGRYNPVALNVCSTTDLTPVKKLGLTVVKRDPRLVYDQPNAGCLFDMKSKDGFDSSMLVEVAILNSAEQADQYYRVTRTQTVLRFEGLVPNLGDAAEGYFRRSTAGGGKTTEYFVQARIENLVIDAFITLDGDEFPDKSLLAEPAREAVASTIKHAIKG